MLVGEFGWLKKAGTCPRVALLAVEPGMPSLLALCGGVNVVGEILFGLPLGLALGDLGLLGVSTFSPRLLLYSFSVVSGHHLLGQSSLKVLQ